MRDIEANFVVEVEDVSVAISRLHQLTTQAGGEVINERLADERGTRPEANLTLRVPSAGADGYFEELSTLGAVRSRDINARDVGKEYYDASLRLRSLRAVYARYEQILAQSRTVEETLRVEEELSRIRGEIEAIEGQLRWLADRSGRATVNVRLYAHRDWVDPVVTPEAKFYPGLRIVGIRDLRGAQGAESFGGLGFGLRFSRHFSIDLDGLQQAGHSGGDLELFMVTLGGESYSDFLGGGQRRWLNPYLGFRGGYARDRGTDEILLGGTLGLEVYKSDFFKLDLETRAFGGFFGELGSHVLLEPGLAAHIAF